MILVIVGFVFWFINVFVFPDFSIKSQSDAIKVNTQVLSEYSPQKIAEIALFEGKQEVIIISPTNGYYEVNGFTLKVGRNEAIPNGFDTSSVNYDLFDSTSTNTFILKQGTTYKLKIKFPFSFFNITRTEEFLF